MDLQLLFKNYFGINHSMLLAAIENLRISTQLSKLKFEKKFITYVIFRKLLHIP